MMICTGPEENSSKLPDIGAWSSWQAEIEKKQLNEQSGLNGSALLIALLAVAALLFLAGDDRE